MRFAITLCAAMFMSGAAWAETITIDIKSFKYNAADVTISVGDTVIWVNQDRARHTATARDGSFNTGTLKKGTSNQITLTDAGTFEYFCKFHRNMVGRIIVN